MGARDRIRTLAPKAIRASGLPGLVRAATRRRATVAFYHDPTPETFERHLRFLRKHYEFIGYDELLDALRTNRWSDVPERALAFTFDDGAAGNHALLPLFRAYGVRPTIYVCTGIVGTQRGFWFNEAVPTQALKRVRNEDRIARLKELTGFEPTVDRPGPRQALSHDEILEMAPDVDFGSHTRSHPILTQCSDAEAWDEIEGSRQDLEKLLGRPCRHFCSPNGDWGDREVELIRKAGYESARTTDVGWVSARTDPYRVPVAAISDDASVDILATQLAGIPRYARNLARGRLGGGWPQQPVAPR